MYTYIIIDDEPLIRRGTIKKMESFPGVSCIAQASNGQTALELICEKDPDFIITDMKMPIMDGTRLLPVLSTQYPDKHIIVISGYKDFEFAQQALRANTIDYIVKPFSQETLWAAVSKVIAALEHRASLDEKLTMNESEKETLKYEYDKQLLRNLLFGFTDTSIQFNSSKLCDLTKNCCYFLTTINLQETLDEYALSQFLSVRGMDTSCILLTRENTDNMAFLLCFLSNNQRGDYHKTAVDLQKLLELFFNSMHSHPIYGISHSHRNINQLHEAFLEASEALNQMTLLPDGNYRFYEISKIQGPTLNWPKQEQFLFLVETGQAEEVCVLFPELFYYFARKDCCRLKDAKNYCMEIVEMLQKALPKYISASRSPSGSLSILNNLNFIFDFRELQEYFLQIFCNFSKTFDMIGLYTEQDVISNIKNYINHHYDKDLTLEFIASLFHLNRSYLSSAFKARTGISFVDYTNQVRVEHAKELLRKTDKKNYQIAQAVGYENSKYFFRIFKKLEGITPEQYRKE